MRPRRARRPCGTVSATRLAGWGSCALPYLPCCTATARAPQADASTGCRGFTPAEQVQDTGHIQPRCVACGSNRSRLAWQRAWLAWAAAAFVCVCVCPRCCFCVCVPPLLRLRSRRLGGCEGAGSPKAVASGAAGLRQAEHDGADRPRGAIRGVGAGCPAVSALRRSASAAGGCALTVAGRPCALCARARGR